jgi:hypothetical protein
MNETLKAMLADYENTSNRITKKESKFNENDYFGVYLKDGVKTAMKKIRIIPSPDGSFFYTKMWGHSAKIEGNKNKSTFACLEKEKGEPCPFCEARMALYATGDDTDKLLAKTYYPKLMYVVKVIDRDNEDHGVKFWRYNDDSRKIGVQDKILGIIKTLDKDITDAKTGRDLSISIARDQNNYPIVQTITQLDPSPLSEDKDLAEKWLSDTRTWKDVYAIKPYEYLEIVVKGGVPMYDKFAQKYIDKKSLETKQDGDKLDSELSMGIPNKPNVSQPATFQSNDGNEEEELPF